MIMPGRKFVAAGSGYRYGFNGKENDRDAGEGIQDYGMRIYSERLGRFLSADPIAKSYPELSAYQFGSNSPIGMVDIDGLEGFVSISGNNIGPNYRVQYDVNGDGISDYNKGWAGGMLGTFTAGTAILAIPVAAPAVQAFASNGLVWAMHPANQAMTISAGKIFLGFLDPSPGGEISQNLGAEGSGGFEMKTILKSIWRNAKGVRNRGQAFEVLASMTKYDGYEWVGQLDKGFFPTIDFVKNQVGVQLKTFFGKASSFGVSTYKGYVDKIVKAVKKGAVEGKDRSVFIKGGKLDILVPEGYIKNKGQAAFKKIWEKFDQVIEYGKKNNVEVTISADLNKTKAP